MIVVRGALDLHGTPQTKVWTRLASSAKSGQNFIIIKETVTWEVGNEIVITTTDTNITHTERHRIASIENGTRIRTVTPLAYTHLAITHEFPNGRTVNVAAAVGLLTRSIQLKSDYNGNDLSGLRIFVTTQNSVSPRQSFARLSNVQFIGFGRFDATTSSDVFAGVYLDKISKGSSQDLTNIDSCSFDTGFNTA